MKARPDSKLASLLVLQFLGIFLGTFTAQAFGQRMPEAFSSPSVASQAPTEGKQGDYVGWETCAGCHHAEAEVFAKTPHAHPSSVTPAHPPGPSSVTSSSNSAAQGSYHEAAGCETCHGPGKAHADGEMEAAGDHAKEAAATKLIFAFHAGPKENSARCLACHTTSQSQEMFTHSQHAVAGISCNECHASHLVKATRNQSKGTPNYAQAAFYQVPALPETARWLHSSLLKESDPNLCFSCHGNVQAQFALPVHHRVPEGLMKCSDCHNPHGSVNRASLNAPNWEACVKCHMEKRGPYVYEHAALRVEGCVVCHNPHGSDNRLLMIRREGRQLCLQCHTGFHGQAGVPHGRLGFQNSGECTRCHVAVHGSALDPYFLR